MTLSKELAEALGYRVIKLDISSAWRYLLLDPQGYAVFPKGYPISSSPGLPNSSNLSVQKIKYVEGIDPKLLSPASNESKAWSRAPLLANDASELFKVVEDLNWQFSAEIDDSDENSKTYVIWLETCKPGQYTGRSLTGFTEALALAILSALKDSK